MKCKDCGKQFTPGNQVSKDSDKCEDCLLTELENYPILPPRIRRPPLPTGK